MFIYGRGVILRPAVVVVFNIERCPYRGACEQSIGALTFPHYDSRIVLGLRRRGVHAYSDALG